MTRFFNPFSRAIASGATLPFRNDFVERAIALFSAVSWVPLLLFTSGVIIRLAPANAQQRLPEPRIFDELPPPSPSSLPSLNAPASPSPSSLPSLNLPALPLPPALPNEAPAGREFNFQAPSPPIQPRIPTPASNLYRVDILGDSPLLLLQVRQLEPEAFVRREGVIQAGVFVDRLNAQSRARALEAQGIRARVTTISGNAVADSINFGRLPRDYPVSRDYRERYSSDREAFVRDADRSYFVVIPGNPEDLPDIAAQVVQLGIRRSAVNQREAPRGPHIAVGPFYNRGDAERWSNYLRSVGMDARVHFGS